MRRHSSLSGLLALVLVASAAVDAAAQGPPVCPERGVPAPDWFRKPPPPPPDTYQAEARSGGCVDAEAAQRVAYRLATWLLLHEKSRRILLEETRLRQLQVGTGPEAEFSQELERVERALTSKILERSWVHLQDTYWSEQDRAEHFLILRADTAAVRELATSEIARRFNMRTSPLEPEPPWLIPPPLGRRFRQTSVRRHGSGDPAPEGAHNRIPWQGPDLRRLVLSGQVARPDGPHEDSLPLHRLPSEAFVGLTLTSAGAPVQVVWGAEYRLKADTEFDRVREDGPAGLKDERVVGTYLFLWARRLRVPLYAGYRRRWLSVTPERLGLPRELGANAGVLGLGFPPFVELGGARVKNLYLEATLLPQLRSLAGGGRFRMLSLPGASVNALFRVSWEVLPLGEVVEATAGVRRYPPDEAVLRRFGADGGLELDLGGVLGIFGLWRLASSDLAQASSYELDRYGLIFQSMKALSDTGSQTGLVFGVRLAVGR